MPPRMYAADLDAHTVAWVSQISNSGDAYLTPAKLDGQWMVRISIGAETTTREHVEKLWETLQAAVLPNPALA